MNKRKFTSSKNKETKKTSAKAPTKSTKEKKVVRAPIRLSSFSYRNLLQAPTLLRPVSLSAFLFVVSLGFLMYMPEVTQLAQSKLFASEGLIQPSTQIILKGQVAGAEATPVPQIISHGLAEPTFNAKSVLAEDLDSGQLLYQKNIHERLLPASTTKLMTALVGRAYFKPTDILTATKDSLVGGSTMGLSLNEQMTFQSLLYGMLINSGNDAAFTIAANYPGGISAFVAQMNLKAQSLGLTDTHFQNPAGFDDPTHYSSAYDLAKIAEQVTKDPLLSTIVDTKETTVDAINSSKEHLLKNVDELLSVQGVIGIKTGYTEEAGENFIGLVDRNGHKVLTVVLDSTDRFGETSKLMDWVYQNYTWQ